MNSSDKAGSSKKESRLHGADFPHYPQQPQNKGDIPLGNLLSKLKGRKGLFIFDPLAFQTLHSAEGRALKKMGTEFLDVLFGALGQDFKAIIVQAANPAADGKILSFVRNPLLELTAWNRTCRLADENTIETSCHYRPPER